MVYPRVCALGPLVFLILLVNGPKMVELVTLLFADNTTFISRRSDLEAD